MAWVDLLPKSAGSGGGAGHLNMPEILDAIVAPYSCSRGGGASSPGFILYNFRASVFRSVSVWSIWISDTMLISDLARVSTLNFDETHLADRSEMQTRTIPATHLRNVCHLKFFKPQVHCLDCQLDAMVLFLRYTFKNPENISIINF